MKETDLSIQYIYGTLSGQIVDMRPKYTTKYDITNFEI